MSEVVLFLASKLESPHTADFLSADSLVGLVC